MPKNGLWFEHAIYLSSLGWVDCMYVCSPQRHHGVSGYESFQSRSHNNQFMLAFSLVLPRCSTVWPTPAPSKLCTWTSCSTALLAAGPPAHGVGSEIFSTATSVRVYGFGVVVSGIGVVGAPLASAWLRARARPQQQACAPLTNAQTQVL